MKPEEALDAVTAERARTMACPLLVTEEKTFAMCIAHHCMAWRPVRTGPQEFSGYCGIAGAPLGFHAHLQRTVMAYASRQIIGAQNDS